MVPKFVVIYEAERFFEKESQGKSRLEPMSLITERKEFLYYNLYYEASDLKEDSVTFHFYYRDNRGDIRLEPKWVKYKTPIVIALGETLTFKFALNRKNEFVIKLRAEKREDYEASLAKEREFNALPFVEKLRRQGKKELPAYKLVIKEHYSHRDVYDQGEGDHESEFEVIEGNVCKTYYSGDDIAFTIEKVIGPGKITLEPDKVIEEGSEYEMEKTGGGHNSDGPYWWHNKITLYLTKK